MPLTGQRIVVCFVCIAFRLRLRRLFICTRGAGENERGRREKGGREEERMQTEASVAMSVTISAEKEIANRNTTFRRQAFLRCI